MKTFIASSCVILLTVIMVQCAPTAATPPPPPAISYSKLAFQWPVTLCSAGGCLKEKLPAPEVFKLHGLWPTNNDWKSSLTNCAGDNFTANPIQDIRASLQLYWPSFLQPENGFWGHEWKVHGTCSNLPLKQFFDTGLQLARKHGKTLLPAFAKSGIRPGSISSTPAGIRDALVKGLGVKCQLKCLKRGKYSYWLQEIYLCLDNHFNLQNCPDKDWFKDCGEDDTTTTVRIPIN